MRFDGKSRLDRFDVGCMNKCPYCGTEFPTTLDVRDVWLLLECGGLKYMCPSCGEYAIYSKESE